MYMIQYLYILYVLEYIIKIHKTARETNYTETPLLKYFLKPIQIGIQ